MNVVYMHTLSYKNEDLLLELWLEKWREQERITGGY